MTTNHISIKSVLYDLSLLVDDKYWNENKILEWLHKGLRQINTDQILQNKLTYILVDCHKAQLPQDLKYLTQVAYTKETCGSGCFEELNLPENSTLTEQFIPNSNVANWKIMRLTSSPFHSSICREAPLFKCDTCTEEFTVDPNLILTTTLDYGILAVAYKGYLTDEEGCVLIPDAEDLKEALLNFVLYRYWLSKYTMMEEGAESRMKHHLSMWQVLSVRASGNLNLPDLNELENLKNQHNRLVPREHRFDQGFQNLASRENVKF